MALASMGILRGIIWAWAVGDESIDIPEAVEELALIASSGMLLPNTTGEKS